MASGDKAVLVEVGGGGGAGADAPEVAAEEEELDDIGVQRQESSCCRGNQIRMTSIHGACARVISDFSVSFARASSTGRPNRAVATCG